jgi:hypothetical protein
MNIYTIARKMTVESFLDTNRQRIPTDVQVSHARAVAISVFARDRGRVREHSTTAVQSIANTYIGNESPDGADELRPKRCLPKSDVFFELPISIPPLLSHVLPY